MSITEQKPRTRRERPARGARPRRGPVRRPSLPMLRRAAGLGWPVALAMAICVSAFAVDGWADRRSEGAPAANRALIDKAATEQVVADVSAKVERIFTYTHTDPAATERAANEVLTGDAGSVTKDLTKEPIGQDTEGRQGRGHQAHRGRDGGAAGHARPDGHPRRRAHGAAGRGPAHRHGAQGPRLAHQRPPGRLRKGVESR